MDSLASANTYFDWKKASNAHVFKVDLPGLSKEEVKVDIIDGKILQISEERKGEEMGKYDKWNGREED